MALAQNFDFVGRGVANPPRRRAVAINTEWVCFAFLVVGLAWVPFWFGSDRLIAWGVNAVIFPGLAALYEFSLLLRGARHPVAIRRAGISAGLFGVVVLWILLQNVTWMPGVWQHPIWQLASEALGRPVTGSISIDRSLTTIALLRLLTAASVFWLALQLSRDAVRARWLIWFVVGISAVYAAVGICALELMPNGRLFDVYSPTGASKVVTSTFVNQNHYVTFAGIGFISAVGLILRLYRRELGRTGNLLRLKVAALIDATGMAAVSLALAFVILTALLLTGSRGGIIATGIGFLVLFALNVRRGRQALWHEALLLIFGALVVGAVFVSFSDIFIGRVSSAGLYEQGRLRIFALTVASILAAPFAGFGHGTFSTVFPMFRDDSMSVWVLWDKAHNTYLETFQGLGLVFGGMLIVSVIVLVWECLKGARTRQRDGSIPAIAAGVSFLVGVHALVDFSLQLQAVTLTYMAILGAGVAQARADGSKRPTSAPFHLTTGHLSHRAEDSR